MVKKLPAMLVEKNGKMSKILLVNPEDQIKHSKVGTLGRDLKPKEFMKFFKPLFPSLNKAMKKNTKFRKKVLRKMSDEVGYEQLLKDLIEG